MLCGGMELRAFVPRGSTAEAAATALRCDLLRSLLSRTNVLIEGFEAEADSEVNPSPELARPPHTHPKLCNTGISSCPIGEMDPPSQSLVPAGWGGSGSGLCASG